MENVIESIRQPEKKKIWVFRVTLILGISFFFLCFCVDATDPHDNPKSATMGLIQALTTANSAYVADNGPLPKNVENHSFLRMLSDVNLKNSAYIYFKSNQVNQHGELVDRWGTPFRIFYVSDSEVGIISAGPDKIFGTPDDITNQ